jgi:AcrR family transcriptional regulator
LSETLLLDTRIEPRQARAQRRIADILRATETLLAAGEKVTTSAIAVQARIPVGSVYRYFPNVFSIYRTLFEKLNGELRARIFAVMQNADDEKTWEMLSEEILAQAIDLYRQHPAYGNLLQMMADPMLQKVRQECVDETSKIFAARWRAGKDGFHNGDIDLVAQTASKLFTFVEQAYFEQLRIGGNASPFLEMVKTLRAYLSLYLST